MLGRFRAPNLARSLSLSAKGGLRESFVLVVVGGGSGGLACAREAAAIGARVAVLDKVSPSPHGTKWGIGGTCVNVGCIPKKLLHHSASIGEILRTQSAVFGWNVEPPSTASWSQLIQSIVSHRQASNFGYVSALRKEGIEYWNAVGSLGGVNGTGEVIVKADDGAKDSEVPSVVIARHVVVATGTRPVLPHEDSVRRVAITSDDLFSLSHPPGRTVVVGGGYVALECAGFLHGLGFPVSVVHRSSTFLRGFDRDMVDHVVEHMKLRGIEFLEGWNVDRVLDGSQLAIQDGGGATKLLPFDTLLYATGRLPTTASLNLKSMGVRVSESGKILGGFSAEGSDPMPERTSHAQVFAIGDVLHDNSELTPVAIKQGIRVARTLFGQAPPSRRSAIPPSSTATGKKKEPTDWSWEIPDFFHSDQPKPIKGTKAPAGAAQDAAGDAAGDAASDTVGDEAAGEAADGLFSALGDAVDGFVSAVAGSAVKDSASGPTPWALRDLPWQRAVPPAVSKALTATAVFTPVELATVGLSEEAAIAALGSDAVDVFWSRFDSTEEQLVAQERWTPNHEVRIRCCFVVCTTHGSTGAGCGNRQGGLQAR
jgi:thioredoxin reductase (NADPH)